MSTFQNIFKCIKQNAWSYKPANYIKTQLSEHWNVWFSIYTHYTCVCMYLFFNVLEKLKVGSKLNIQQTKVMAPGPITSWQIERETVETVTDFTFGGSKITADGDCSHEIKRHLFLRRKAMTNLDSILKSRDITLPTKGHLVKAMVFPVVMYGCESWTVKKAELWRIDVFELWCWRRFWRILWTARDPTWRAAVYGVAKSWTQLSDWTELSKI